MKQYSPPKITEKIIIRKYGAKILKIENEKLFLESEQDVIEYIEIYKKAILQQIKLRNKIKI